MLYARIEKIYIWTGVLGLVVLVTLLVMWLRPAASSAQRSDVTAAQLSAASAVHPSAQNAANTTMPFSSTTNAIPRSIVSSNVMDRIGWWSMSKRAIALNIS